MASKNSVVTGRFGTPRLIPGEVDQEKYRAALEAFAIFSEIDRTGAITYVNKLFCDISGYAPSDLVGSNHRLLHSGEHSEEFINGVRETLARKAVWHGELCCRARNGDHFWVVTTIIPILSRSGSEVEKYMSIQFDVTDKRNLMRTMDAMSKRDMLTNLPNGSEFSRLFALQIGDKGEFAKPSAVAILDIDGFKAINDTHGHYMGDELLVQVAGRLTSELGADDLVARIGGDEFALFLCYADHSLQGTCARILTALKAPFRIGGIKLQISASMGIRLCPGNERADVDQALRHANIALYRAKSENKNCYRIFDADEELEPRKNALLRNQILSGLTNNEFEAHFQPIVDLASSALVGFESLIRWQHPVRGLLSPGDFLPAIENDYRILMIGEWMLSRALEFSQTLFDLHLPQVVSVNIAASHLQHPGFVCLVKSLLQRHGNLPKGSLIVEITESAAFTNLDKAINVILQCKELGVKFSLDDFGTGFSSLTYLRRLPVDELKIDREFIEQILIDHEDQSIVSLVTQLGEIFGLRVVAEGIETVEQLKMLREMHCHYGQGFGIARPMPLDLALAWAKDAANKPIF